jgi:hypothetical protein
MIRARLEIETSDGTVTEHIDERFVEGVPDDRNLDGTFRWLLDPEQVVPDAHYAVSLWEAEDGDVTGLGGPPRVPAEGYADLGIRPESMRLHVVVLPLHNPEGGIDPTDAVRASIEQGLLAGYPIQQLDLEMREPIFVNGRLTDEAQGWDILASTRSQDGAAPNVYYHLLLENNTCCVEADGRFAWAGIGGIGDERPGSADWGGRDAMSRVEVAGDGSIDVGTIVHEIGHNHGRPHAPCGGVSGTDPDYPQGSDYLEAGIGVQGFDIVTEQLYNPFPTDPPASRYDLPVKDVMSYCWPNWWSDYNWQNNLERVRLLTSWDQARRQPRTERPALRAHIDAAGSVRWSLGTVDARFVDAAGGLPTVLQTTDGVVIPSVAQVIELPEGGRRRITIPLPAGVDIDTATVHLGSETFVYQR